MENDDCFGSTVTSNQLCTLLETKQTFPLFIYSNSCSICATFKDVLLKYIDEYGTFFYRYESNSLSNDLLLEKFPEIFQDNLFTPALLTFEDGKLVYVFQSSKMTSYNKFRPVAKSHLIKTNITTLCNKETFTKYINDNQDFLLFSYDSANKSNLEMNKFVYDIAKKSNKKTLLLDIQTIDFYNIFEESIMTCQIYEGGQIKSATTSENGDALFKDLINSFY